MLGGHANTTGFVIKDKEHGIIIKSKEFKEEFWDRKSSQILNIVLVNGFRLIVMFVAVFLSTKFLSCSWWLNLLIGVFGGVCLIYLTDFLLRLIVSFFVICKKDLREYHACEHKTINLLELESMLWATAVKKDMPGYFLDVVKNHLTIENLQKESSTHPGCGSGPEFIQKHFTTKEPSREKLEEALEVAREYCRRIAV